MGWDTRRSDKALLNAARDGDADAFAEFYERYREQVLAYFARRIGGPEPAADLTAELFARMLALTLSRRRPLPDSPASWLFSAARNLLVDSLRRGQVEANARQRLGLAVVELDDHDIDRIAEIQHATDHLERLRSILSPVEWEAVHARFVEEVSYPELAHRLRCSEAVARKRVSRGLAHLRTSLEGHHE
jgi:RNA polymerase sigma-70 factor (ECF subfamily)